MGDGGVTLTAPEIAENGNTVPIEVSAEGASAIMVLAARQPDTGRGDVQLRPAGRRAARIDPHPPGRHAGRVAIAKLADGSFAKASKNGQSHNRRLRRLSDKE